MLTVFAGRSVGNISERGWDENSLFSQGVFKHGGLIVPTSRHLGVGLDRG